MAEKQVLPEEEEESSAMENQVVAIRTVQNDTGGGGSRDYSAMLERSVERSPADLEEWKRMRNPDYWSQRLQREGGSKQKNNPAANGGVSPPAIPAILPAPGTPGGGEGEVVPQKDPVGSPEQNKKIVELEEQVESLKGLVQSLQGELAGQKGAMEEFGNQLNKVIAEMASSSRNRSIPGHPPEIQALEDPSSQNRSVPGPTDEDFETVEIEEPVSKNNDLALPSSQTESTSGRSGRTLRPRKLTATDASLPNPVDVDSNDAIHAIGSDQSFEALDDMSSSSDAEFQETSPIPVKKVKRAAKAKKPSRKRPARFPCKKCRRVFQSATGLQSHDALKHRSSRKKKSFVCAWKGCNQSFFASSTLYSHVRRDHKKIGVQCPHCPGRFPYQFRLDEHLERVHGPGKAPIKCPVCGAAAASSMGLSGHMRHSHKELQNW